MPKRTNDFQALITHIYESTVPEVGTVTESGMVYDTEAEILREVDILVEYKFAGHEFSFIVECRDRSRKETVEWIDALVGKVKSLKVNKVIAVSSKGFAAAAIAKAKANDIETLTLEEANETHWGEFPIKPGILLISGETYNINDVLYKNNDKYYPITSLGIENNAMCKGAIVGSLKEIVQLYFEEHIVPQIDEYKKKNLGELFKTKEDTEKILYVEGEYTWPEISVIDTNDNKTSFSKIKYIITGTRRTEDVKQEHKVLKDKILSVSQHKSGDGTSFDFKIVQDPDTRQIHFDWIKDAND